MFVNIKYEQIGNPLRGVVMMILLNLTTICVPWLDQAFLVKTFMSN